MLDEPRPIRTAILMTLLVIGGLLGAAWYFAGVPGLEKTLTALVLPLGLVWMALLAGLVATIARRHYGSALLVLVAFAILTAAGNETVAAMIVRPLEAPYVGEEPAPSVDTLVLLGGGVWETPSAVGQGGDAGDRVMTAAAAFHAGRAQEIRCTGTLSGDLSRLTKDEAEIGRELLIRLGVPAERVSLGGGGNTSGEIAALAADVEAGEVSGEIGIVTSAWHMSRVMRLADAAGLNVTAVPADFRSGGINPPGAVVLSIVPSAGAMENTTMGIREHLAKFVDR